MATLAALGQILSDADSASVGIGVGGVLLTALATALFGWLRGIRPLAPIVAAVEWFRRDGARGFDLSRYGLPAETQARLRADLQEYLWASLRDAIASLADKVGLLKAVDARVQAITEPLKRLAEAQGAPATVEEKAAALRRTTGVMAAFRPAPGDVPPELGRAHGVTLLGVVALALALASVLCTPGCVAAEVPHAAARLAATARILEAGARAHDVYASGSAAERAAALAGYQDLTAEHRRYAEELVAASGGDLAEVDAIEAAWRQRASERARARREAAGAITGTAVPR